MVLDERCSDGICDVSVQLEVIVLAASCGMAGVRTGRTDLRGKVDHYCSDASSLFRIVLISQIVITYHQNVEELPRCTAELLRRAGTQLTAESSVEGRSIRQA